MTSLRRRGMTAALGGAALGLAACGTMRTGEAGRPPAAVPAETASTGRSDAAPPPEPGAPPRDAGLASELRALRVQAGTGPARPLGELIGTAPALVAFWATYCLPCRLEVPVLNRAAERLHVEGVRVLGVATDGDDPVRVARAVAEWGIAYETVRAAPGERERLARLLPAGLPATVATVAHGAVRRDALLDDAAVEWLVRAYFASP